MGDWFMPPGAPQVGSGAEGERDAVDGVNEGTDGAFTMIGTALFFEGSAGSLVARWRLNSWVRSNIEDIAPTVSRQAQARHVFGTRQWLERRGGYFLSSEDAQQVLEAYRHKDVTILGRKKNGDIVIRYDNVIGFNRNEAAGFGHQPTHVFFIKGTRKVSVVPYTPEAGGVR